ncbi:hypothetical protein [Saccharopolyspora sp. ASAGF58]|uniref:hypothetical protein n=1 Tax=Saccharopolyspora sp. ASAGF58 TaxID=2719023 RepID=UPI0014462A32|nr:hypothetical protein [Saccharopolyspora sp. ASAGF58]
MRSWPAVIGGDGGVSTGLAAGGRRGFPDLADSGRRIARPLSFADAADARTWLRQVYRA